MKIQEKFLLMFIVPAYVLRRKINARKS